MTFQEMRKAYDQDDAIERWLYKSADKTIVLKGNEENIEIPERLMFDILDYIKRAALSDKEKIDNAIARK